MKVKLENKSRWILSAFVVLIALGYILASLGRTDGLLYTTAGIGVLFGLFILGEAGVMGYIRGKKYKSIGIGDIIVWISFVVGSVIILNSIVLINAIRVVTPEALLNFLSINGAVFGGLAGVLAIALLFTGKPE